MRGIEGVDQGQCAANRWNHEVKIETHEGDKDGMNRGLI